MKYSPRFGYTFTPGTNTLDLSSNAGFNIKGLLAVIDSDKNVLIYAASSTGLGYASISGGNVLTLQYNCAALAVADNLVFIYDDGLLDSGKVTTGIPTPVADGSRADFWLDEYGRQVISDKDSELGTTGGTTSLRDRIVAQRVTIASDSLADGISTFWVQTVANGGNIASTLGEGQLKTSTAINGSAQLVSPTIAYYPGQVNWLNSAIRFGDTGVIGNIRRIGMFTVSAGVPQDGFYFELNDTTLNACYVKAGAVTATPAASWSRVAQSPFVLNANYQSFELRYTANSILFYVNNILRHSVSGTVTPLTGTITFPITIQNIKTAGATDISFSVRNVGNGRFGMAGGVVPETGQYAVEALAVGGGTPNASTDTGNPLKIGGYAKATAPTAVADGQRTNAWFSNTGALNVTGGFFQATQPVSLNILPALATGTNVIGAVTQSGGPWTVSGTFFQATQPVSLTTLPALATGTNVIGGVTQSNGPWTVSGTFFQATQPVSLTTLPALTTGANVIGAVTQSGTWNIGSITTLPTLASGTNTIGSIKLVDTAGSNTGTIKAASTAAVVTDTSLVIIPHPSGTQRVYFNDTLTINSSLSMTANTNSVVVSTSGIATTAVSILGTWTGVVLFEATIDGTNYFTVNAIQLGAGVVTGTGVTGNFKVNTAGFQSLRTRSATAGTGTATVTFIGTSISTVVALSESLPSGTAIIGGVIGDVASGITDANAPLKIGGQARITQPTAVTDGQRVNATFDKVGRQLVVGTPRSLKFRTRTNIAASTAETTIITAGATGVFNDVYGFIMTNNGAATMSVTIRDVAAGTPIMVFQVPATDTRGMMLPVDSAVPQNASVSAWTATCTPNATSIDIVALYVQNI